MKRRRHDVHALTGVYALDALPPGDEHDRFIRHVDGCQACAAEVSGLREVGTAMALAAAAEPPVGMRARVLAAVGRTRQLPPETHSRSRSLSRSRPSGFRVAVAVAMAAAVAVAVLAIVQINTDRQLSQSRRQSQAIAAVLSAPDARILARPTAVGGVTTVVVSAARRELVVTTEGMPVPRNGQVYELWLIGPPRVRPAGILPTATAGHIGPILTTGLVPGDKLGMTIEPAGGTSQPTTTPIVVVPLPP
jgi:Anti-sigma-K factor rskA